jgi:sugar phosphate isomerase/epimerase
MNVARYEQKFAEFLRMFQNAQADGIDRVVVFEPQALGDTYDEMVESLNRLADAELALSIVPRSQRGS